MGFKNAELTQSVQTQMTGLSAGVSTGGNTAGTTGTVSHRLVFVGGDNITLSQSVDAQSATITISGAAGGAAGSNTLGMSNLGNTAGTTGVVSGSAVRYLFAGGNNVTLSQSIDGVSGTVTISGANTVAQSLQTQVMSAGLSTLGNTAGDTGTVSRRVIFAGGNNITLSGSTDGSSMTITVSGVNTVAQSLQTQVMSAGLSNIGNTAGDTGTVSRRLILAGGNNITLSGSTDGSSMTVTISGAAAGAAGSNTFGMSNLGNTSGTSGVVSGSAVRYLFAGGNNITLSQSLDAGNVSGTVTISAANIPAQTVESNTFGMSNLGNTAGTSGVISGGQLRMLVVGGPNITVSQSIDASSATLSISAAAPGGGAGVTISHYPPMPVEVATSSNDTGTTGAAAKTMSLHVAPMQLRAALSYNLARLVISGATVAGTGSMSMHHAVGIYTRTGDTLSRLSTFAWNLFLSQNSVTAQTAHFWWGSTSNANSSSTTGNISSNRTGLRVLLLNSGNESFSAGQYWIVYGQINRSSNSNVYPAASALCLSSGSPGGIFGGNFLSANTSAPWPLIGQFSTTTNESAVTSHMLPASIHTSVITNTGGSSQWKWPSVFFLTQ